MDIHGADVRTVLVCPDGVEQVFPGKDPVGIAHQVLDDVELLGGQVGKLVAPIGVPGIQIQTDGAAQQLVLRGFPCRGDAAAAAEHGADAGLELEDVEGLGQVIVRALVKTQELVHIVRLGGQQDDGHIGELPDLGAGLQTVQPGHHHIQHDQIGVLHFRQLHGLHAVAAGDDLVAVILKVEADALDKQCLVIHNKDLFHMLPPIQLRRV